MQCAVEDLFYARAINRIRRDYVNLHPDAEHWFLLSCHDDPPAVMVSMGLASPGAKHSRWHLLSHTASMVAVVTSIIGGACVALTVGTQLTVATSGAIGALVAVTGTAAFAWHQASDGY